MFFGLFCGSSQLVAPPLDHFNFHMRCAPFFFLSPNSFPPCLASAGMLGCAEPWVRFMRQGGWIRRLEHTTASFLNAFSYHGTTLGFHGTIGRSCSQILAEDTRAGLIQFIGRIHVDFNIGNWYQIQTSISMNFFVAQTFWTTKIDSIPLPPWQTGYGRRSCGRKRVCCGTGLGLMIV